jgi:acetyl esterase
VKIVFCEDGESLGKGLASTHNKKNEVKYSVSKMHNRNLSHYYETLTGGNIRMTLHTEIKATLQAMKDAGFPAMHTLPPQTLRAAMEASPRAPGPDMLRVEDFDIAVDGGTIKLRLYVPTENPIALIDFMHGGGWTFGSINTSDTNCRYLARNTNCSVVSVDYRLAPEHPFPTAVNDAYAALQWIDANKSKLGAEGLPLVVQGDSAGGNLTAVLCIMARDQDGPKIAAQVMTGPATDGDIDAPALKAFVSPFLSLEETEHFYDLYVPNRADRSDYRFAPMNASSHADLPPALIITAEHDILRTQGEAYGQKLMCPPWCAAFRGRFTALLP